MLDILAIGPFLLFAMRFMPGRSLKIIMASIAIGTILYNWNNYAINEAAKNDPRPMV